MEMKKVACAVLFAAASVSAVMAHGGHHAVAPAAGVAGATDVPAPAPGPASGAAAVGSLVGASLLSFVAYYLQF